MQVLALGCASFSLAAVTIQAPPYDNATLFNSLLYSDSDNKRPPRLPARVLLWLERAQTHGVSMELISLTIGTAIGVLASSMARKTFRTFAGLWTGGIFGCDIATARQGEEVCRLKTPPENVHDCGKCRSRTTDLLTILGAPLRDPEEGRELTVEERVLWIQARAG